MRSPDTNPPPPQVFERKRHRGLIAAVAVLVILALAWTGGWFWLARWADAKAAQTLDDLARHGVAVACADRGIVGFPFALRMRCAATNVAERSTETQATLAGLTGGASVFAPMTAELAMASPAHIDSPQLGSADANWEDASVEVGIGMAGPRDIAFDASRLEANVAVPRLPVEAVAADRASGSLGPSRNGGTDLAVNFDGLGISMGGALLPAFSGSAAAEISVAPHALLGGRAGLQAPVWARGIDVALESGGSKFAVSGDISIDAEGVADGKLVFRISGLDALPALIAKLPSSWQKKANGAVGGIIVFGKSTTLGGKPASEVTVEIERSTVRIGNTDIVTLPPVPI